MFQAHTIVLPIVETAAGAPTAGVGTLHLGYRRTILRFSIKVLSAPIGRSLPLGVAILAVLIGSAGFFIFLLGLLVISHRHRVRTRGSLLGVRLHQALSRVIVVHHRVSHPRHRGRSLEPRVVGPRSRG